MGVGERLAQEDLFSPPTLLSLHLQTTQESFKGTVLTRFIQGPFEKTLVHHCPCFCSPTLPLAGPVISVSLPTGHLQARGALSASASADPVMYGLDDFTPDTSP